MTDYRFTGNDNYGRPKADYLTKIAAMDDTELLNECEHKIWLSAYANNNPRSDYHWHVAAIYAECQRREKPEIYQKGYNAALRSA